MVVMVMVMVVVVSACVIRNVPMTLTSMTSCIFSGAISTKGPPLMTPVSTRIHSGVVVLEQFSQL